MVLRFCVRHILFDQGYNLLSLNPILGMYRNTPYPINNPLLIRKIHICNVKKTLTVEGIENRQGPLQLKLLST